MCYFIYCIVYHMPFETLLLNRWFSQGLDVRITRGAFSNTVALPPPSFPDSASSGARLGPVCFLNARGDSHTIPEWEP